MAGRIKELLGKLNETRGRDAASAHFLRSLLILGIVNFHCILRTLQLRDEGRADAYGEIFARTPMIGFSTYGEACIGHINQTSTMLVFQ